MGYAEAAEFWANYGQEEEQLDASPPTGENR